jgi:hypothetical protein
MSQNDQNDISDIQLKNPGVTANTVINLPIRGEKRIVPSPVSPVGVQQTAEKGFGAAGLTVPQQLQGLLSRPSAGFNIEAARTTLTDYVMIRIGNRGLNAQGTESDSTAPLVYRFLINPKTVSVNHSTLDSQTLTRAGWQFGVWGEDTARISMSGSTAGRYFLLGLTDAYAEFTESYRNLTQLQIAFENNGYWFEGEQLGEGPLAANATRRRIKMQNDVQLIVGDFIWYGAFESLQISQDADNPFLANFSIEFMAWKERFRKTSPYWNNIENNVQRGHSYQVFQALADQTKQGTPSSTLDFGPTFNLPPVQPPPPPTTPPTSPAVLSVNAENNLPNSSTTSYDYSPGPSFILGDEGYFLG